MKRLIKHRSLWLCCALLFLPFMIASPSNAQCTLTTAQLEAVVASCTEGDMACFASLAAKNVRCSGKIAWYYTILNKPDNPDAVLESFLKAIEKEYPNLVPIPSSYAEDLSASINAAHEANLRELETGSPVGLCNKAPGEIEAAVESCGAENLDCLISLAENNMDCADKIVWSYMILNKPDNPGAVLNSVLSALPSAYAEDVTASLNAAYRANQEEENVSKPLKNEYPYAR